MSQPNVNSQVVAAIALQLSEIKILIGFGSMTRAIFAILAVILFSISETPRVAALTRLDTARAGEVAAISSAAIRSDRMVVAMSDGSNNLRLITWDVGPNGGLTRRGTATAGTISEVSIAAVRSNRVVVATRDGSNNLRLIVWDIDANGNLARRGQDSAGIISQLSIAAVTSNRVVVAIRDGSNNLRLIAWDIDVNGELARRGQAAAGTISKVSIAALGSKRVVTAIQDGSNNLRLIAWDLDSNGNLIRRGEAAAGTISQLSLAALGSQRVVTAIRDGSNELRLIAWDIDTNGNFIRRGEATAGIVGQVSVASINLARVVTAVRDGSDNLLLIAWRISVDGRIIRRGSASAGGINQVSIVAVGTQRWGTSIRSDSNELILITWEDTAVPGRWVSIGPSRIHAPAMQGLGTYDAVGRLTTIAVRSNGQTIYAGSAGQLGHEGSGVWKTDDGGKVWVPVSDSLPAKRPTLSIGAIAIDPANSNRSYIVTADEGLFRSEDAGVKWEYVYGDLKIRTNTNDGDRAVLLINPKKPNVLYVTSDDGVLRSADYGKTWDKSLDGGRASGLVMDPQNPDVLYAAMVGKGIYKTDKGGEKTATGAESWKLETQGISYSNMSGDNTILVAISHAASATSETVYALLPNTSGAFDLYRSDGKKWSKRYQTPQMPCGAPPCPYYYYAVMGVDPTDWKTIYLGGQLFWTSADGGDSFTNVPKTNNDRQPASPHGDYWELVIDPDDPAILYAGSDGGIFRSTDHGKEGTWEFIGEGIKNAEMYDLALANTKTTRAISGTQDNGTILYDGAIVWDHIPHSDIMGGDGAAVAIDPTDQKRFYAVLDNRGTPSVSLNSGEVFTDFSQGLTKDSKGLTPCAIWNMTSHIQIHPTTSQTLLEPCQSLWRTTTNVSPANWTSIFTPAAGEQVVRSAVDPKFDIYYAGTNLGRIYFGAGTPKLNTFIANSESLNVSDIEIDKANTDTVYVSFAPPTQVDRNCGINSGTSRIHRLKLTVAFPANLTIKDSDITANLPSGLCVNALAVDPFAPRTVYAATNNGVYRGRSDASGTSWTWLAYDDGMPPADVRDLEVHPVTGNIFAATFGRGAFEVESEMPEAAIIANRSEGSPAQSTSRVDRVRRGIGP
jgi:hypothetical protein